MKQNANVVVENVTQRLVQNVSRGSSAAALRAATASAVQSSSSTNTNVSTRCNLAQFQQALINCASKFSALGSWIDKQVREQMEDLIEKLNIPNMLDQFKKLSPLMKVLVVFGILALLYLLKCLTWEAVSFVWPYVMQFIESDSGKKFIEQSTQFLESIGKSEVMTSFDSVFATAAIESENASDPTDLIPCFEMPIFNQLTTDQSSTHIDLINTFFTWFTSMMNS